MGEPSLQVGCRFASSDRGLSKTVLGAGRRNLRRFVATRGVGAPFFSTLAAVGVNLPGRIGPWLERSKP
jgi:hypothetical protein